MLIFIFYYSIFVKIRLSLIHFINPVLEKIKTFDESYYVVLKILICKQQKQNYRSKESEIKNNKNTFV